MIRDPEGNKPGHYHQQLALDRQRKWPDTEAPPFFQEGKGFSNNLRYHHPFVIPPAEEPSVFDEKMRMITVNTHHYFMPDKNETAVATFSRLDNVREVQTSELLSRSHFPEPLDPSQTRHEVILKAVTHETIPTG